MGTDMSGKVNGGQENGGKLGGDENQINGGKFLFQPTRIQELRVR